MISTASALARMSRASSGRRTSYRSRGGGATQRQRMKNAVRMIIPSDSGEPSSYYERRSAVLRDPAGKLRLLERDALAADGEQRLDLVRVKPRAEPGRAE